VAAAARAFLRPHTSETIRGPENKRLDMTKPNRDAAFGRLAIDRLCKSAASRSRRRFGAAPGVSLRPTPAAYGVGVGRLTIRNRSARRAPTQVYHGRELRGCAPMAHPLGWSAARGDGIP